MNAKRHYPGPRGGGGMLGPWGGGAQRSPFFNKRPGGGEVTSYKKIRGPVAPTTIPRRRHELFCNVFSSR